MRALSSQWTRRRFLGTCGAVTAGFLAYRRAFERSIDVFASVGQAVLGYGAPIEDPARVIDLPRGFRYQIISHAGDEMSDGLVVPGLPDAMAAFPGPDGQTLVIRNHECLGTGGAFGSTNDRLAQISAEKLFDLGAGITPCAGGTTTFVWDTKSHSLVAQHLSLAGTVRNCAGGSTPWGTWLTCEETVLKQGFHAEENLHCQKDHGWVFEVPVKPTASLADPTPITAMGRFVHEACVVDPRTGIVYLSEDREDGLLYRFLPNMRGDMHAGGRLQALALDGDVHDTRNWPGDTPHLLVGAKHEAEWIDMEDVEAPEDDLRMRGFDDGACRFARTEGMWMGQNEFYFACTDGGRRQIGQIFRYAPGAAEGTDAESDSPGHLELFVEPNDPARMRNPDNVAIAPWGDLVICEDHPGEHARLVGITPTGGLYTFARARVDGEFAGATFSPDGTTLFVNIQQSGITLAITGPWRTS